MRYPSITIITINYNGLKDTKTCIKHVLKTKYPNFKLIVIDNASRNNEAELLKKFCNDKRIRVIPCDKNYGFSGGNNKAFRIIKDKYIVLLNNDTQVAPNWLTPLVEKMESDTHIAAVQPKILWLQNKKYFDYAGANGGYIDFLGYPFTRGRIFNQIEKDLGQYDTETEIFWASGATVMLRRSVLEKVGYLDERFFCYMEEIDLCFRIQKAGYKIFSVPKSIIYHKVAATSSKSLFRKRFWEHRNSLLLYIKNYPPEYILFLFPIRVLLDYLAIIHYLSKGQLRNCLAVLAAHFSFAVMSPRYFYDRFLRKRSKIKYLHPLVYKRSIVLDYFFRQKKYFSSLNYTSQNSYEKNELGTRSRVFWPKKLVQRESNS